MISKKYQFIFQLIITVTLISCDSNDKDTTTKQVATPNIIKENSIDAVLVDVPVEDETKLSLSSSSELVPSKDISESQAINSNPSIKQAPNIVLTQPNEQYVQKMLDGSIQNDENIIQESKQFLESQIGPPKGDKKSARVMNDDALKFFKNQQYEQSTILFAKASQLDPADIEILNNYGTSLLKSGNLGDAWAILVKTLTIKPDRSPAWASLADTLALQGKVEMAVASYLNAYRFSKNKENTHKYFKNQQTRETNSLIREALTKSLERATSMYFSQAPEGSSAIEN
ncbi:MAG: hypothetical protein PHY54_09315 [Methylococcales bacterium]|nr:hypothetical protein [Methylococcales bacterium]